TGGGGVHCRLQPGIHARRSAPGRPVGRTRQPSRPAIHPCVVIIVSPSMPTLGVRFNRSLVAVHRRTREWLMLAKGIRSTSHPVLAHIVPTRRCNLACTYCNEFDDFSKPVPAVEMLRRIDLLADLG